MYYLCSTTLICFFFFNDTATTEIYTLSLHDALPISQRHPTPRRHVARTPPPDRVERGVTASGDDDHGSALLAGTGAEASAVPTLREAHAGALHALPKLERR